ncbi:MAG: hypothetical protein QXQ20_01975, partial [Candidatus Nezhaarchaeales archaeon]
IAAVIAKACSARRLILVKDVDGIYDPSNQSKVLSEVSLSQLESMKTCLDPLLPSLLRNSKMDCIVVNGLKPDRIRLVIEGLETICTKILTN